MLHAGGLAASSEATRPQSAPQVAGRRALLPRVPEHPTLDGVTRPVRIRHARQVQLLLENLITEITRALPHVLRLLVRADHLTLVGLPEINKIGGGGEDHALIVPHGVRAALPNVDGQRSAARSRDSLLPTPSTATARRGRRRLVRDAVGVKTSLTTSRAQGFDRPTEQVVQRAHAYRPL
ncbi:UNVERIFIED_CONTAM: hypothetical protein LK11_47025 [Mumia flava]